MARPKRRDRPRVIGAADAINRDAYILIAQEHAEFLRIVKDLREQVQMQIAREKADGGAEWVLDDALLQRVDKLGKLVVDLVSEGRNLAKARACGELSDELLDAELAPILEGMFQEKLDSLTVAELQRLIDIRKIKARR